MNKRIKYYFTRVGAVFLAVVFSAASNSQSVQITPEQAGYDGPTLEKIVDRANLVYEAGLIPNYAIALAKDGEIFFSTARGDRTLGTDTPVDLDTLFPLASMSKPITSSAVMQLVENGELSLDSKLSDFFPLFGSMLVAPNGSLGAQFEPAVKQITIEDLLTHRSGLTYRTQIAGNTEVADLYEEIELMNSCLSPDENMELLSQIPLIAQPGSEWNYSVSLDVLGAVIGVVSGVPLGEYVSQNIFDPLGIDGSKWRHEQTDLDAKYATLYEPPAGGQPSLGALGNESIEWQLVESSRYSACPVGGPQRLFDEGGSGLVGSVNDYILYASMIANRGTFNGVTVLKEETVDLQLTERLDISSFQQADTKRGFGLGFGIVYEEDNSTVDYVFWGGSNNTGFFIDPKNGTVGVQMSSCFRCRQAMIADIKKIVNEAAL